MAIAQDTDIGLSLDSIEKEIMRGLPSHAPRLASAYVHEQYLAGKCEEFIQRRTSEEWVDYVARPKRASRLTRKVCRTLSESLYSPGPTRKFETGDKSVDDWLNMVYETNHVTAIMQRADQKAVLNSTTALQVVCGGRLEKPVTVYLWGAHEYQPFMYPTDPCMPWAIVTIQHEFQYLDGIRKGRLNFEAWSRDEHRVYETAWIACLPEKGDYYPNDHYQHLFGNSARYIAKKSGKNPYGCLPFTFVHDELPVCSFWEGGLGTPLCRANREIDRELSDLAQSIKYNLDPDRFLRNVAPGWRREKRPGGWQHLTPAQTNEDMGQHEPDAFVVQYQLPVEQVWLDIRNYADTTLEELDVPLTVVHDMQSVEVSGVALAIKRIPLTDRVRARQPAFTKYELDLVRTILTAAGNFYSQAAIDWEDPGMQMETAISGEALLSVAEAPKAEILWPEPQFSFPTPERDAQDEWEMQTGLKSLIDVAAQRYGSTREQAIERIEQVVKDNELLATILPPPPEPTVNPPTDPSKEPIGKNEPQPQPQPSANGNGKYS